MPAKTKSKSPAQLAVLQDVQGKFKRIRELILAHKPVIAQSRLNRVEASYSHQNVCSIAKPSKPA